MSSIAGGHESTTALVLRDEPDCSLPNVTLQRLSQFRRRRTTLGFYKGLGIACCASIVALLTAVVCDSLIASTAVRMLGSLVFYAVTFGGCYWLCLKPVLSPTNLLDEANRIEQCDDRFVERLVPAVELSEQLNSGDSAAFRQQLQHQVAGLIAPLDVRHLLPWSGIRNALLFGIVASVGLALLCSVPSLHLPHRIARTLFPMADLGRVSRVAIAIERPMPNSKTVPIDDLVGIVARVTGPKPETVILEKRATPEHPRANSVVEQLILNEALASNSGRNGTSVESPDGQDTQFESVLSVASGWVEYRVKADGAETPWYRLTGKPRPKIERIHKSISGPDYAGMAAVLLTEDHGDIETLVGSRIRLELELNTSVSAAQIEWIDGIAPDTSLKLEANQRSTLSLDGKSTRATLDFTVERNAKYRIHLTARETGFTNAFSPTFSISAIGDLPPKLSWLRPQNSNVVVGRDQLVNLSMKIDDELPVKSLVQMLQLISSPADMNESNGWKSSSLQLPDENGLSNWNLDLLPLKLSSGDYLKLKVAATDRKGQITESTVVQFMIATTSIDIAESGGERIRQEIAEGLESLAGDLTQSKEEQGGLERLKQLRKELEKDRNNAPEQSVYAELEETSQRFETKINEQTGKLLDSIEQALVATGDGVSAMELRSAGRLLSKLKSDTTNILSDKYVQLLAEADSGSGKQQRDRAREFANSLEQSLRSVDELAGDFAALVTHDVLSRRATQLTNLANAQAQLKNAAEQRSESDAVLRRQQMILGRQMQELQQQMRTTEGVRGETAARLLTVADEMNWMIEQTERLEDSSSIAEIQQVAETVSGRVSQLRRMQHIDGGVTNMIKAAWRRTSDRSGAADDAIEQWVASLKNNSARPKQAEEVAEQLADRRTLNRTGSGADREFASDLGKARRALSRIAEDEDSSRQDKADQVKAVGESVATLAANSALTEAANQLAELTRGESWSLDDTRATTEHPRMWEAYASRLEQAVNKLRDARVPNEIVSKLDQMRWNPTARRAAEKIVERNWRTEPVVSAAAELQTLSSEMQEIKGMLTEITSAARENLDDLTPKLSELANKAAETARDVQDQTQQLADEVDRGQVPDTQTRVEGLEQEVGNLQEPLSELREALVDQADAQDLLESRELQLARQADAAIGIVDQVEEQTQRSLDPVQDALQSETEAQAQSLTAAAEKQADAAAALEQLAQHFEQTEQLPDDALTAAEAAEQLAELNEFSNALNNEQQAAASSDYDQAEALANLNEQSPQEALRRLEEQLKADQVMQQEMSQIARRAAEQALDGLEHAAQRQRELQPALEASDPIMQAQKELLTQDLQSVRQQTQRLMDAFVKESRSTAAAGKQPVQEQQLRAVETRLRDAHQELSQLNASATFDELRDAAADISETLDGAARTLAEKGRELDQAKGKEVHQNDADLNNRRREMRDRQRRIQQQDVRASQQAENSQRQALNRAESSFRQTQQRTKSEQLRLDKAKKQAAKQPESENLKQQVQQLEQNVAIAQANQDAREVLRDAFKQRVEAAKSDTQQINQAKQLALDSKNPSAELAAALATRAADRSRQIVAALEAWGKGKAAQTQASEQNLAEAGNRQREVGQEVEAAADALARASRHEERLENQATSTQLGELAEATDGVNQQEIPAAEQQLTAAVQDARESGSATIQASVAATQSASSAIAEAELAIEQSADAVRGMLSQNPALPFAASSENPQSPSQSSQQGQSSSQNGEASASASSSGKPSSGGQPLSSQQMAQLLDELDRQLNSQGDPSQNNPSQNNLGQQDNNQSQSGQDASAAGATPSTLAEAARKLAASLSQSRQPPSLQANSDMGMATEGLMANANPQAPVAVRLLDIERLDGQWGELREQSAEEMIETRRDTLSPKVRRQVDAYFKILAERSQKTGIQETSKQ